jgi:GntR family transcriptional regulator/MocR family aminotransferase
MDYRKSSIYCIQAVPFIMAKQASTYELALAPRKPRESAYRWLAGALRNCILKGELRPGSRLPATRDLSRQYGLSRGTIVRAFEELKSEGYVECRVGSGTRVSRVLPDDLLRVHGGKLSQSAPTPSAIRRLSVYARDAVHLDNLENRPSRAFRANLPAVDLFPLDLWAQIAARILRRATVGQLLACPAMGHLPLRGAIAEYLTTSRGVRCVPEQVAIVAGIQEALDLAARLFIDPRDRVCIENPGYPGARGVFQAARAMIGSMDVDDEGMVIDERKLRGARLVYVTPGHQFPLGVTMSLPRRLRLLEWARNSGAMIFEDDYDSEYRYVGRPVPALQSLDSGATVLLAGSFSKVLFPSLRLGYIVFPEDLVDRCASIISVTRRHAPLLDQLVLCNFIREGHFGRHLRRMRQIYAERLSVLIEVANDRWTGLAEIPGIEAGLQTVARLHAGLDAENVAIAAARRKVEVTPVDRYRHGRGPSDLLQLGFAAFNTREIRRGARDLTIALEEEQQAVHCGHREHIQRS